MENINIKWFGNTASLNQIYSSGLEYSFLTNKLEQCHVFVHCKDYLNDAVWSTVHKKPSSIYGFTFKPENPQVDLENIRLLLTNRSDKDFLSKIPNVLDFINQIEAVFNFSPSVIRIVENPPTANTKCGVFEICGDKRWLVAPVLLSLYALLVRIGFVHTAGANWNDTIKALNNKTLTPYQKNDASYISRSLVGIEKIINLGYDNIFSTDIKENYKSDHDISTIHNYYGIVSFSDGTSRGFHAHWFRPEIQKRFETLDKKISLTS